MKTANCIFYNRPLDNMVYQFSISGIPMKGFYFDFGKKEIPQQAKMDYQKYKELYKHAQALVYFTIINNQYILGQIREDNQYKTFLIDRAKDIVYINEHPLSNNVGKLIGCNGDQIISYINPGEYLKAIERNEKMDLPQEVINHLKNEGFTHCVFELPN